MKKLLFIPIIILVAFAYTRFLRSPASSSCSLSPCHGLELSCTTAVPQACTLDYQLGDRCRRFASCQTQNGRCQLTTDSRFASCLSCVQNCQQQFPDDPIEVNQCESVCAD